MRTSWFLLRGFTSVHSSGSCGASDKHMVLLVGGAVNVESANRNRDVSGLAHGAPSGGV